MRQSVVALMLLLVGCAAPNFSQNPIKLADQYFGNEGCWQTADGNYKLNLERSKLIASDYGVVYKINGKESTGSAQISTLEDITIRRISFQSAKGSWREEFGFDPNNQNNLLFTLKFIDENKGLPETFTVGRQITLAKMNCDQF